MSWIERSVEERLAKAAAAGELDTPHLNGKPLPDLDRPRGQGWWADQFVRRELSHDRRERAEAAASAARSGFWRAVSLDELRERVGAANDAIAVANVNLVPADQMEPFHWSDIRTRWEQLPHSR